MSSESCSVAYRPQLLQRLQLDTWTALAMETISTQQKQAGATFERIWGSCAVRNELQAVVLLHHVCFSWIVSKYMKATPQSAILLAEQVVPLGCSLSFLWPWALVLSPAGEIEFPREDLLFLLFSVSWGVSYITCTLKSPGNQSA